MLYFLSLFSFSFLFFFFSFLFYIAVEPINNVVMVPDEQRRDSAIRIHVPILPQTPFPSRLPLRTEQSSLCYTVPLLLLMNGSNLSNLLA